MPATTTPTDAPVEDDPTRPTVARTTLLVLAGLAVLLAMAGFWAWYLPA